MVDSEKTQGHEETDDFFFQRTQKVSAAEPRRHRSAESAAGMQYGSDRRVEEGEFAECR